MTYDEYRKIRHKIPYLFNIEKNGQHFFYFGAKHLFNPKNKQFRLLKKYWEKFLDKTKGVNSIVFVEGGKRPQSENKEVAIKEGGEAHFITFLASQENIETISPEPEESYERSELLKKFSKEEIQYYYFARVVYQWHNLFDKPVFENYISRFLKKDARNSNWKGFDLSIENMKKIHKNLFNKNFDEDDKFFFHSVIDPTSSKTVINLASRESGIIRDNYIVKEIKKYWNGGKNIFVVYGVSHAVMQEPELRRIL